MKTQIWLLAALTLFAPIISHAQKNAVAAQTQNLNEPNARLELERVAKALVDKELFGSKQSLERERQFVADNSAALQIFRNALQLPYRAAPLPDTPAALTQLTSENFSVLADYRYMARLLVTESRVRAADKDFTGALQSAVDTQRLGALIRSDGPLIQMMVGVAIEAIARKQLRELLPQLDRANMIIALQLLQSATAAAPTYAETVRVEAAWTQIFAEQLVQGVPQPLAQQMRAERQRLVEQEIAQSLVPYIVSAQQARGDLISEEFMEGIGEEVPVPAELTADIVPALVAKQFAVNKKLYQSSRFLYENNRAQNALLLADFALRAYELEHGKPAISWDEIVPKYLPQAPVDPFDYVHALRLTTRDQKTVPYSIGPDGLDDKGVPIDNGEAAKYERFRVNIENRGDIVSGINLQ